MPACNSIHMATQHDAVHIRFAAAAEGITLLWLSQCLPALCHMYGLPSHLLRLLPCNTLCTRREAIFTSAASSLKPTCMSSCC